MTDRFEDRRLAKPDADVRMRGFRSRVAVEDAQAWIDSQAVELFSAARIEEVELDHLPGRSLAEPVCSPVDVPGFDRAMMDGFAVCAESTQGASSYNPRTVAVIGQSLPGRPFQGAVEPDEAVRIMTGAPMPVGADAVLPAEVCDDLGNQVRLLGESPLGKHVEPRGEDIKLGAEVLSVCRRLRPQDVGVLSSMGRRSARVWARPQVTILITGDELLPAGTAPRDFMIADANGPMLAALVKRDGGVPNLVMTPDSPEAILSAMAAPADVVLVSGGSSVGQEDHAPMILDQHGHLAVHGVAMRPSSPAGAGRFGDAIVCLLPGNPVSCLCAYDFFAGRAIRQLGGLPRAWPYRRAEATLVRKLVSQVGRTDYARVAFRDSGADAPVSGGGGLRVEPLAVSGASILSSTTRADGFVVVPADSEGHPPHSTVSVFCYDPL